MSDIELPRSVTLALVDGHNERLELTGNLRDEVRRFQLKVYSIHKGALNDLVAVLYEGLHQSANLYDFANGYDLPDIVGTMVYDNFIVTYNPETKVNKKVIYTASIEFDANTVETA